MARRVSQSDPALAIDFFISGFYSYRSQLFAPFKSIGVNVVSFHDPVIDGINFELTDKLEWSRRPGFSIFCPVPLLAGEVVNQFYSSRILTGTVLSWADTTARLTTFTQSALTTIVTKTTPAQGYVETIGNMTYFADGAAQDYRKYDSTNVTAWGLAAPSITPTATGMGFWQPDTGYAIGNTILDPNGNIESVSAILASNGAIESPTDFTTVALAGGSGTWAGSVSPGGTISQSLSTPGYTNYLFFESFNLAIPSDATIVGIVVQAPKYAPLGTVHDQSVKLVVGGAVVGTDHASVANWNQSALTTAVYGGPLDTWGTSVTPAQANTNGPSGFGFVIAADVTSTNSIFVRQTAIANVQGGGTLLATFINPIAEGNNILVAIEVFNETLVAVQDTQGNGYDSVVASISGESTVYIFSAPSCKAGLTSVYVTFAGAHSDAFSQMNIHEVSGLSSVTATDGTAALTAPPFTPFNTGTVTTANAEDLIFSANFGAPPTPPAGYTLGAYNAFAPYGGATQTIGTAFLVVNATGTYSPTWTQGRIGCTCALQGAGVAVPTLGGGTPEAPVVTIYFKRANGVGGPGLSGPDEPNWSTTLDGTVNDGGLAWTNYGPIETWFPLTAYDAPVVVLDPNGFLQLGASIIPPVEAWDPAVTYGVGITVAFGGGYWISTANSNTGVAPNSGYSVATTAGATTTTVSYWAVASNPVVTGTNPPVWSTTLGGFTEDGNYQWTNIGQGSGLAFVGHAYVYGYRTIYGHLTTSSPFSNNTGAILGPLQGSIIGFSLTSNVVTFQGNNNFLTGNVFTVSGLLQGTYFNNQTFTVIFATPSESFPLTAVQVVSNVVTITAINNLVAGQTVTFSLVGGATFLNGQVATVLSSGLSGTQFEIALTVPNYGPTDDAGTVAVEGSWTAAFTHADVAQTADSGIATPLTATISGAGTGSPLCNSLATITAIGIVANVVTITASNNFQPGLWVTLTGIMNAAFLNGLQFQVIAVDQPIGTQNTYFQVYFEQSNYAVTPDMGTATFNAIEIYRTSDGGGSYLFDGAITNPGNQVPWIYNDFVLDADLDIQLVAPLFHQNDPPPGAPGSTLTTVGTILAYWQGRLWMAVGNYIYFDAGPDCTNGIPEESWPPAYRFQFAGPVLALVPTADGVGLMVYLADRVDMILGGPETISFYPTDAFSNFGISNPNAIYRDGSIIGQFTTQRQYFELVDKQKQDIGERIGDYLSDNFNASLTYATMHRDGLDVGVFLSNGVDQVIRYGSNISAWSVPAFPVFGAGALRSIETSPGIYSLMLAAPATGTPIITGSGGPQSYILQDRRKSLVLTAVVSGGSSPVPNFTLRFVETINNTVIASVPVVNPNGTEKLLAASAFIDQATVDGNGQSVWAQFTVAVDATSLPVGVMDISDSYNSLACLFDAYGTIDGCFGVYPDPDRVSIWVSPESYVNGGAFQKYNTRTKELTDIWQWPFNGNCAYGIEDGTTVFFQDSVGNLYGFSNVSGDNSNNAASGVAQRLHKVNQTTKMELGALGYDDLYPPPGSYPQVNWIYDTNDWALFTYAGHDYVALQSAYVTNVFAHVIDLTTMTLVGSFSFSPLVTAGGAAGVWVDEDSNVWWGVSSQGDTNLRLYKWIPLAISGTSGSDPGLAMNLIWTIPGSEYQSGTPVANNAYFFRYVAATNAVIVSGINLADNGNAGDLAEISLTTGAQVAFVPAATSPARMFTGTLDGNLAAFRVSKLFGTTNTSLAIQGDCLDSTVPSQRGGILNIINPSTLAIEQTYNIVQIADTTTGTQATGGGYTYRGVWSSATVYAVGDIVTGSDGFRYLALTTSGPGDSMGTGVANPTATQPSGFNTIHTYWQNWVGLPGFSDGSVDSRSPNFIGFAGMMYFPGVAPRVVTTNDVAGGPLMLTELMPQTANNYLYARDVDSWGDAGAYGQNIGIPYPDANIVIGNITLSALGAPLFPLQHVVGYFDAVGTLNPGGKPSYPNIWILPNEVNNMGSIPFVQLPEVIQEPPIGQNQPSSSLLALRWPTNMMNSQLASQYLHHLQVKISWEPENAPNTLKAIAFKESQVD